MVDFACSFAKHPDVSTTMISTHVLNKKGPEICSPLDGCGLVYTVCTERNRYLGFLLGQV